MFKKIFFIILIIVAVWFQIDDREKKNVPLAPAPVLIINSKSELKEDKAQLPRNFRTSEEAKKLKENDLPSTKGMQDLNIIGSAQFSDKQMQLVLKHLPPLASIYVVDLRQEWHGFLNGVPVTWYGIQNASNRGKLVKQIEQEEWLELRKLKEKKDILLFKIVEKDKLGQALPETVAIPFQVQNCATEEQLAAKYNLHYIRIPVGDASKPEALEVEKFVHFFDTLPPNSWIYFHCAAGRGRTTSFMAMYDMLKNSSRVSFEDIIKRQHLIGGSNLANYGSKNSWKYQLAVERYQFLKQFYDYTLARKKQAGEKHPTLTWSAFLQKPK